MPGTPESSTRPGRLSSVVPALLAGLLALAGCGSDGRSAEAFCAVMDKHRERYEDATGQALTAVEDGNLLGGSLQMVTALGDLQVMWDELAEVAPEEIRADAERVRDHNREQLDMAQAVLEDPLKGLAGGLMSSLSHGGSYDRLNSYAADECGTPPF